MSDLTAAEARRILANVRRLADTWAAAAVRQSEAGSEPTATAYAKASEEVYLALEGHPRNRAQKGRVP